MKLNRFIHMVLWAALTLALAAGLLAPAGALEAAPAQDGTVAEATAVVATGQLNVRTGPGVSYAVITRVNQHETITLTGRNASATWVRLRLANGGEGWVNAYYISASVPIRDLVVVGTTATPTPATNSATVTVTQLELRAGPGASYALLATLGQNQALTLLGRTSDSTWVKVQAANVGEGWVMAQVTVRVPGNENGVTVTPFQTATAISSLPVATVSGPRATLSTSRARPATPVYVTMEGFPANRDVAAVLTSKQNIIGMVVARGRTDANGYAQLYFRVPDSWPNGSAISDSNLSLAAGTVDGAVLIWTGLAFSP